MDLFTIEAVHVDGGRATGKYVVDHSRDVSLRRVCTLAQDLGEAFELTHAGRSIPFEASAQIATDSRTGQRFLMRRFTTFGTSSLALRNAGIQRVEFGSATERNESMKLATEALIVYGGHYTTGPRTDGDVRIEIPGKKLTLDSGAVIEVPAEILTLRSFGYVAEYQA